MGTLGHGMLNGVGSMEVVHSACYTVSFFSRQATWLVEPIGGMSVARLR